MINYARLFSQPRRAAAAIRRDKEKEPKSLLISQNQQLGRFTGLLWYTNTKNWLPPSIIDSAYDSRNTHNAVTRYYGARAWNSKVYYPKVVSAHNRHPLIRVKPFDQLLHNSPECLESITRCYSRNPDARRDVFHACAFRRMMRQQHKGAWKMGGRKFSVGRSVCDLCTPTFHPRSLLMLEHQGVRIIKLPRERENPINQPASSSRAAIRKQLEGLWLRVVVVVVVV